MHLFSCFNDVMNHFDCIIKRDVYPQKMHSCSKNIRGISFFVLKISVANQKINTYTRTKKKRRVPIKIVLKYLITLNLYPLKLSL